MEKTTRRLASISLGSAVLAGIIAWPLTSRPAAAEREERREERRAERRNPHIYEAIDALNHAKEEINSSKQGFSGHKAEAVARIDSALEMLERIKDLDH